MTVLSARKVSAANRFNAAKTSPTLHESEKRISSLDVMDANPDYSRVPKNTVSDGTLKNSVFGGRESER